MSGHHVDVEHAQIHRGLENRVFIPNVLTSLFGSDSQNTPAAFRDGTPLWLATCLRNGLRDKERGSGDSR